MGFENWDTAYTRVEKEPIDKFRNKSRLLKEFGPNAVRIYNAFDSTKSAMQIQSILSIESAEFSKVMDFLLENSMIEPSEFANARGAPESDSESESDSDTNSFSSDESEGEGIVARQSTSAQYSSRSSSRPPSASSEDFGGAQGNLTNMEQMIFDQFGDIGLRVYALIDGEKTAEQILNETGISETMLVQILEFMNQKGIIKLEKPPASRAPPPRQEISSQRKWGANEGRQNFPSEQGAGSSSTSTPASRGYPQVKSRKSEDEDGVGFKPMVESDQSDSHVEISPDLIPVDVPVIPGNLSLIGRAKMSAILSLKFGKAGNELISHIDGVKDFVQISTETGLALSDLDIMLGELGKQSIVQFRPLAREEIAHRYGDDGLSVYKKYGRDGLLIYYLIGKSNSIHDIIAKSKVEVERAIEIIIFVHKMLGLDIPLDRDMLYRYVKKQA
ncbi:MAG: hypothetical protein WC492_01075 [Candidatus Micrarchaeia archaeon]